MIEKSQKSNFLKHHFFRGLLGIVLLLIPFHASAISMCPFDVMVSNNGRYVIALYDEKHVVIWDLERLRGGLQPVQVHGFQAPIALSPGRNIAVSANGRRLAYEDANTNEIIVCDMKPGFPCQGGLSLPDKAHVRALEWSPDGLGLLVVTRLRDKGMMHLLSLDEAGGVRDVSRRKWQADIPTVDWERQRFAIGHNQNIFLYDLKTARSIRMVKTIDYPKPLSFTEDGEHIVVREAGELRVYYIHPKAVPGVAHLRARIGDYDLIKGAGETLWYVKQIDGDSKQQWDLVPASASGEIELDRKRRIHARRSVGSVLWIDARSEYAIVYVYQDCRHNTRLINLRTRLVEFELYQSMVNYRSKDFTLPHQMPWLGVDPGYKVAPLPLRVPAALLQYAAIATELRDRYDAIWFGLLTALEPFASNTVGYPELLELSRILVQLKRAEHYFESGRSVDAMKASDAALGLVERIMPALDTAPPVDGKNPALISVVAAFLPVVRNDVLLVRAQSAIALEQWDKAEAALNQILKANPRDWRAHAGRLYLNLDSSKEVFDQLLREAQDTLRLESWTSKLKWGFPPQFFHEPTLRELRAGRNRKTQ